MSRRQMRRHARRHPALVIAAGTVVLVAVAGFAWLVFILAHVLILVGTAAAAVAAYRVGQRRAPAVRLVRSEAAGDEAAERDQLERVILAQRAQLDELETLTGKTVDELLATYRRIASKYGSEAKGGTPQ